MAFFHCSLEVQCAIHCSTEPGSGCFFYAPTATRTYLFPVSHRRPLCPLFTSSRGPTSFTLLHTRAVVHQIPLQLYINLPPYTHTHTHTHTHTQSTTTHTHTHTHTPHTHHHTHTTTQHHTLTTHTHTPTHTHTHTHC